MFRAFLLSLVSLLFIANAMESASGSADTLTVLQKHSSDSLDQMLLEPLCLSHAGKVITGSKAQCVFREHTKLLIEWLVQKHTDDSTISQEVRKRYDCLFSNEKNIIDSTIFPIAGAAEAPLLITAYISATCPLCHYISRELFTAVSPGGVLYRKARFMAKPFGVSTGNLSLYAANSMGKFWEYFIALSYVKERVGPEMLFHIADSLGFEKTRFKAGIDNVKTKDIVQKSTDEAFLNGVTLTPTLFFNKTRYKSYKDPKWIIDAAEIKYEVLPKSLSSTVK